MAKLSLVWLVAVFGVLLGPIKAFMSGDERSALRAAAAPVFNACSQETGVTKTQLLEAFIAQDYGLVNSCFYSCFLKNIGAMNSNGFYVDGVLSSKLAKYISNEDELNTLEQVGQTCSSVNNEPVSDGDQGCDRALMFINCCAENKNGLEKYIL